MKSKLLIISVLFAIAFTANAQTEKGKSVINGSFGFSTNKSENTSLNVSVIDQKSNSFIFAPSYGYFVANNLTIGLGVGYSQSKNTSNSFDVNSSSIMYYKQITKQQIFSVSPFLRKYVDIADKFKFFGQVNLGIGFGKAENTVTYNTPSTTLENTYKFTSYSGAISPGFAFFPSKKWAIEFSFPLLNYSKINPKDESSSVSTSTTETFNFATSSFNPSIGFNFHF